MNDLQSATMARTDSAVRRRSTADREPRTALQQCLVVSPSKQRVKQFEEAAQNQGWATIVGRDADDAAREAVRNRIQLAVVDLEGVGTPDQQEYRALVEQLATVGADKPLLIVCGPQGDPSGEIWSRQLGVWMYLPGIDDHSDVALLCGEARHVLDKMSGSRALS